MLYLIGRLEWAKFLPKYIVVPHFLKHSRKQSSTDETEI